MVVNGGKKQTKNSITRHIACLSRNGKRSGTAPLATYFSLIILFADDCVCYCKVKDTCTVDIVKLHENIDHLGCWARNWGMRF